MPNGTATKLAKILLPIIFMLSFVYFLLFFLVSVFLDLSQILFFM